MAYCVVMEAACREPGFETSRVRGSAAVTVTLHSSWIEDLVTSKYTDVNWYVYSAFEKFHFLRILIQTPKDIP